MKQNKITILVISALLIIIVAIIAVLIYKNSNSKEYIINITYSELKEKIDNKESFIVYIGKTSCTACEAFNPKFKKIVNKYKINTYYIDLDKYTDTEKEYVGNNISFSGTPTVAFIIDGIDSLNSDTKIIGNISEDKIITKLKNRGYIK